MSARRVLGAVLLAFAYLPAHRLLDPARTGPAGLATRTGADAAWEVSLLGTVIVVGLAVALALLAPGAHVVEAYDRLARRLEGFGSVAFAVSVGGVAFALAAAAAFWLHGGMPTSVDEMAQLLHARALSFGMIAMPTAGVAAAFSIQNGVTTPDGWISIYPPLHTIALAIGLRMGVAWLVGPLAVAVATTFATLSFERLMGARHGRTAGLLLCVTPFWILLGGTHLSHTTAAACLALVLWTGLRACDGGLRWTVAAGAAVGAAVTTRPWISLACASALLASLWLTRGGSMPAGGSGAGRSEGWGAWAKRAGALLAGGAPFAALLFWWNARLFGSPFRLGYSVAFGPAHGLGLHPDPWGNEYGFVQAIAYTGADLIQLGSHLLQSPLSAVAIVGLGFLLARDRPLEPVFTAWIVAAIGANALYWHHGVHMGPRMLYESTPAWIALFVSAAGVLGSQERARGIGAWCVALTLLGGAILAPAAASAVAAGRDEAGIPELDGSTALDGTTAVVFAHGSWASRIAGRLEGSGMRRDSIETALRRNDVCAVDRYARWRSGGSIGPPPRVDFEPRPGSPTTLQARTLSPGNLVRVSPDGPRDAVCAREADADRLGAIELETLLWQTSPFPVGGVTVVRDLGPAANAALSVLGNHPWYVYVAGDERGGNRLVPYEDGMELLWRGAATFPLR